MKKLLFSIYYRIHVLSGLKNIDNGEHRLLAGVFWYNKKIEGESRMQINVQKELDTYLQTISYIVPAGLAETWNLLATDSGFARWFLKWKDSVK